jgi:hypothetical protein
MRKGVPSLDRFLQCDSAVLDECHYGRGGNGLGDRRDAEDRVLSIEALPPMSIGPTA